MNTQPMRPAVALAWILGLALILTRPDLVGAILAAVNWTLAAPAGSWVLGAGFLAAIACIVRGSRGWAR